MKAEGRVQKQQGSQAADSEEDGGFFRNPFFFGLRARLVLLVVVALAPAMALIVLIGWEQRHDAAAAATEEALRVARIVAGQQARFIEMLRQDLARVAAHPEMIGGELAGRARVVEELPSAQRAFHTVGLLDERGELLGGSLPDGLHPTGAWLAWYRQAWTAGEFALGECGALQGTARHLLTCGQPVAGPDGRTVALLYATADLKWLSRIAAEAMLPVDATVLLMDQDGRLLGHYPNYHATEASAIPLLDRLAEPRGPTTVEIAGGEGRRLYAVVPAGARGWRVAVGVPKEIAFAAVNARIARNVLALGTVLALALAAAWVGGNVFVVRRLQALVAATRRLAAGNFRVRARQRRQRGELGQLAAAFDEMAAALESREAALQQVVRSLRESEARFRDFFESSPDAVFVDDLEGRVLDVNPAACRLHGLTREQLIGRTVADLVPPARRSAVARDFPKLASGAWDYFEGESLRADGQAVPVELRTRVFRYAGQPALLLHVRDLTERQQTQTALRHSEERFRALIENSLDVVLVLDAARRLRYVSPAVERVLGHPLAACEGRPLLEFVPAEEAEKLWANLECVIGRPGQSALLEFRCRHQDGSWRHFEAMGGNLTDNAAVQGVVLHCRDVTERKRMEQAFLESNERLGEALAELRAAQQQAIQQARLSALGQMASGIAHDFNNALAGIMGFSELLLHQPEKRADPQKLERFLQLIHTGARDAASIVGRLREFYRDREAGEVFQPVDPRDLVRQAVSLTRPLWKEQARASGRMIQMQKDLAVVPPVNGNAAELREALTNLIFNAVDALPDGGTITVSTAARGDQVVLTVADTGVGMTEEVRQHCLDPFFSTKGERGTGLGLAQVYGIVRRHEGVVEIVSAPGQGTTVQLCLPAVAAPLPPTPPAPAKRNGDAPALDILLVEDDDAVADVQAECLRSEGHRVETVRTGAEALARFDGGRFQLVITDRAMPGMSGDQLAAVIKQRSPATPVVMLTGFGDIMKANGEHPPAVDDVLSKPVTLAALRETVQRITTPAGVA